jgi:hypothetical protein
MNRHNLWWIRSTAYTIFWGLSISESFNCVHGVAALGALERCCSIRQAGNHSRLSQENPQRTARRCNGNAQKRIRREGSKGNKRGSELGLEEDGVTRQKLLLIIKRQPILPNAVATLCWFAEMPSRCFRDAVKMLQTSSLAQALPTPLEIAQPTVTCRRDGEV